MASRLTLLSRGCQWSRTLGEPRTDASPTGQALCRMGPRRKACGGPHLICVFHLLVFRREPVSAEFGEGESLPAPLGLCFWVAALGGRMGPEEGDPIQPHSSQNQSQVTAPPMGPP